MTVVERVLAIVGAVTLYGLFMWGWARLIERRFFGG